MTIYVVTATRNYGEDNIVDRAFMSEEKASAYCDKQNANLGYGKNYDADAWYYDYAETEVVDSAD